MSKIITIDFKDRPILKVTNSQQKDKFCHCSSFGLDRYTRLAICNECGKSFDAFECLVILAKRPESLRNELDRLSQQIKEKTEKLESAKSELLNVNAKLKNKLREYETLKPKGAI